MVVADDELAHAQPADQHFADEDLRRHLPDGLGEPDHVDIVETEERPQAGARRPS